MWDLLVARSPSNGIEKKSSWNLIPKQQGNFLTSTYHPLNLKWQSQGGERGQLPPWAPQNESKSNYRYQIKIYIYIYIYIMYKN